MVKERLLWTRVLFFLLANCVIIPNGLASMSWGPLQKSEWKNPACSTPAGCELTEFNLRQQDWAADYSNMFPEDAKKLGEPLLNFGTTIFYEYKTTRPEALEDFVVVSAIRGCVYKSKLEGNGAVTFAHMFARDLLGRMAVFLHNDWQIDSIDQDPMYKNEFEHVYQQNPTASRHGRWEWAEDLTSFDQNSSKLFRNQKPTTGRLFTSDRPGTAFRMNVEEAKNVALEVRACVYPAAQVPKAISFAQDIHFGHPLHCHTWSHKKVFNHTTKKFESPADIPQVCSGEPLQSGSYSKEGGAYFYSN